MRSGTELIATFMLGHMASFCILLTPPVLSQSVHSGCTPNKLSNRTAVALLMTVADIQSENFFKLTAIVCLLLCLINFTHSKFANLH